MAKGSGNKLKIIRGKLDGKTVVFDDSDEVIIVGFNPTEYSVDKSNSYSEPAIPGLGSPIIQFGKGNVKTLSLELLLDTYTYHDEDDPETDIRRKYIDKFEKLIEIDGDIHAPPPCRVVWGSLDFTGVLESLKKKYVLFLDGGIPVRARVSLNFKEYIPVDVQVRKVSQSSPDRYKKYIVKEQDSLWLISSKKYGDVKHWKIIAESNNIDDPKNLKPGQELIILPLKDKKGLYHG